jgi:hypothetical protein
MEVVNQGNSQSGKGGESLHEAFEAAMSDPANATGPDNVALVDGVEGTPVQESTPKASQTQQEAADEIEFEGKKYKVEKAAKDYLKSELDAKKGMRKAFSERDQIKKQLEEISKKGDKWDQIESVFKQNGVQGLFDALAGEEGAYAKHLKETEEKAIRKYNATADELKIIEREEAIEATRKRAEAAEKQLKEHEEKLRSQKEAANTEILEGKIISAHEKVSFKGKLGDEKKEEKFDSYVWERVRLRLNEYVTDKKIEAHLVPTKVVSALFEEEAADFADAFKSQIEASTKVALSKQSDAATLSAQAKASSGIRTTPQSLEQLADENKGSIGATLKALFGRSV